jgi:hypothetical protein
MAYHYQQKIVFGPYFHIIQTWTTLLSDRKQYTLLYIVYSITLSVLRHDM